MWANLMYMLPIAAMLSTYKLKEDFKMEGDLLEELDRLFKTTIDIDKLKISKVGPKCKINHMYSAETNLWQILDGILERYRLIPNIETDENKCVILSFKEGAAWKHKF